MTLASIAQFLVKNTRAPAVQAGFEDTLAPPESVHIGFLPTAPSVKHDSVIESRFFRKLGIAEALVGKTKLPKKKKMLAPGT